MDEPSEDRVEIDIAAPPEAAWDLLSDGPEPVNRWCQVVRTDT